MSDNIAARMTLEREMRERAAQPDSDYELCDGCNVRPPWEHRCHGFPCPCPECRKADELFNIPSGEQ